MSQLRNNPVGEVPKRVLLVSVVVTVVIIALGFFFDWSTIQAVIGFWMGVTINLINFRIIVIGSKNFLDKIEAGKRASMTPNIMLRFLLYAVVFVIAWQIGVPALLASFGGSCMVNFVFKSDGFFTMGLNKDRSTNLKEKAKIASFDEVLEDEVLEDEVLEDEVLEIEEDKSTIEVDTRQDSSEEEEIEVYL